jgi:zinc transport system substrate-binding protein
MEYMGHTVKKQLSITALLCILLFCAVSCRQQDKQVNQKKSLTVVTSLFPLYDFAKNIGKDKADVRLLLPPGVEPHSFEPKPADVLRIQDADIFIYTDAAMEPWVTKILQSIENKNLLVVEAGKGISLMKETSDESVEHGGTDPHIWLDFANAQHMVDTICEGFCAKDPANKMFYADNARTYNKQLSALDTRYKTTLSHCKYSDFVHGGHFAFGYLAKRYNLHYVAAYGFSPDSEPTPRRLYDLIEMIKQKGIKYIFYEELLSPRVAETIAKETGATLLKLSPAHNLTKKEFAQGVSFISIMEQNLKNLSIGLQCQ